MSHKKKKNSRNPAGISVTYIKIYDESPWDDEWYMCGMCGHGISEKKVGLHAKYVHKASAIKLVTVDDTPLSEEEVRRLPNGL